MNKFRKKLLAILLLLNFIGIAMATAIAAFAKPLYGLISLPIIILILSATIYFNKSKIFNKNRKQSNK